MFNLTTKKTARQLITEIHNEFDTAEDRLLEQADNLLAELNVPTETEIEQKAATLKNLGFINSETVVHANRLSEYREKQKQTLVTTREQAELIRYYKQTYPFQKFLTEMELERICEKYNLVFAPVANYIKDVPEKNIKEISSCASLKECDEIIDTYEITKVDDDNNHFEKMLKILGKDNRFFSQKEVREITLKYRGRAVDEWCFTSDQHMLFYDIKQQHGLSFSIREFRKVEKDGLFIAAPPSNFNLKGLVKKGKFSFLNVKVTEVKDPIVFRYVRGGVQVLSKWGLEGEDESLVNEKLN